MLEVVSEKGKSKERKGDRRMVKEGISLRLCLGHG